MRKTMKTQKFTLNYGLEAGGATHYDGEMRLPTLKDLEVALEEVDASACSARVNRHVWARTITRLGDIPAAGITPDLLGELVDEDYGVLLEAENTLRKKRRGLNAATG
jgi:hypothetical protein